MRLKLLVPEYSTVNGIVSSYIVNRVLNEFLSQDLRPDSATCGDGYINIQFNFVKISCVADV